MMKGDRERLNETLAYLGGLNMGTDMSTTGVAEVAAFATAFVGRCFPLTSLFVYNAPMHQFSKTMSLGKPYVGPETVQERKRLRAIYLLDAALRETGGRPWTTPPLPRTHVNPAGDLLDIMWKARLTWGQQQNNHVPHQERLTYIRRNPAAFLQTNAVLTSGVQAPPINPLTGLPTDLNVANYLFQYNPNSDRYEFRLPGSAAVMPGAYALPVAHVPPVHWSAVPGRGAVPVPLVAGNGFGAIHGTELGGLNVRFMVTTQFTGCTFCMKAHNGREYAAHISPNGANLPGLPGVTLAQQIDGLAPTVGAGDFANAAGGNPLIVYGRSHGNLPGHATGYPIAADIIVLGVWTATNGWEVWSQHRNGLQFAGVPVRLY